METLLPHLEKLENLGLVVPVVAISKPGREAYILMEQVNGFELGSFPKEYEDYKFSLDLAKKTAVLFQGFFEAGYYHSDPHSGNIMYDQKRGKCVAVDLDSIEVKGDNISLKDYIQDYSDLMLEVYLGYQALDTFEDLLFNGGLQLYMPEGWEEFSLKVEGYKTKGPNGDSYGVKTSDLFRVYSYQLVYRLMQEKGIDAKIHPTVREFVLCGLNPSTAPQNFDEILNF